MRSRRWSEIRRVSARNSSYAHYCGVVDRFVELLKEKQKDPVIESFKIDGYPDDAILASVCEWADKAIVACA